MIRYRLMIFLGARIPVQASPYPCQMMNATPFNGSVASLAVESMHACFPVGPLVESYPNAERLYA